MVSMKKLVIMISLLFSSMVMADIVEYSGDCCYKYNSCCKPKRCTTYSKCSKCPTSYSRVIHVSPVYSLSPHTTYAEPAYTTTYSYPVERCYSSRVRHTGCYSREYWGW
jgi:hypothetical protein